ncbi:MAG: AAA family ATPase, partial [Planctomycetota bacterium]
MKILRLRLENYRGIDACELRFATQGVTVVEGPNEIGKSSLAEALDVLFDELDSTTKRSVKAIQPVDRDVGTLIEVDVETGPYAFTYLKRFFKEKGTELKVTAPRPENLRGREAHDRVRAILQETIDEHLWRGLRVQQGSAVAQAEGLHRAPTLLRALDRSAGTTQASERELGLFETVHEEYLRYFTEGGKERKDLREAREAEDDAAAAVRRLTEELVALERDVERSAQLEREVADLERKAGEAKRTAAQRADELKILEERTGKAEALAFKHKAARAAESVARNDHKAREALLEKMEELRRSRKDLEARAAKETPALKGAEKQAERAREELADADREVLDAKRLNQLRERDMGYHGAKLDLELMSARRERIEEAQRGGALARQDLETIAATDALLERIAKAHLELERSQARLDAGSPQMAIEALDDIDAEIDGTKRALAKGETLEQPVAERSRVRVPGQIEITVTAGASVDDLVAARDRLHRELRELLGEAGAKDL